jgi:hypothetical protein
MNRIVGLETQKITFYYTKNQKKNTLLLSMFSCTHLVCSVRGRQVLVGNFQPYRLELVHL